MYSTISKFISEIIRNPTDYVALWKQIAETEIPTYALKRLVQRKAFYEHSILVAFVKLSEENEQPVASHITDARDLLDLIAAPFDFEGTAPIPYGHRHLEEQDSIYGVLRKMILPGASACVWFATWEKRKSELPEFGEWTGMFLSLASVDSAILISRMNAMATAENNPSRAINAETRYANDIHEWW